MNNTFAQKLVSLLPASGKGLFNPWTDRCQFDDDRNGPQARLDRLARHLDCEAGLILVGEAPGYQGCRYSGIAFTSERLLMEGSIPRIDAVSHRISTRNIPFSEPSATIVWKALYRFGVAETTILWNALQMHPFRDGCPWSNRTPTDDEIAAGAASLRCLRETYPTAKLIAVGRKAEHAIHTLGMRVDAAIRHPANGGATEFTMGLQRALASMR